MDTVKPVARPLGRKLKVYNSVVGAAFFHAWLDHLSTLGWDIECHSIADEQIYRRKRGILGRLWLRWQMYGGFAAKCWRVTHAARAHRPLRIVTTNPFFAPWLVNRAAAGSGATINLVYDLFPDALVQTGLVRGNSWLAGACAMMTRRALQECEASVFLGERLRRHAELRYGPAKRAVVIPVGADGTSFRNHKPNEMVAGQEVVLLYAGQMGRMHDSATIRDVLVEGLPKGLRVRFHSSGAVYQRLRSEAHGAACEWGTPLTDEAWQRVMLESQVALVTMVPGAEKIVMPSKTYSALVAGQAIMAICPKESDLADMVRAHDCGWIAEPGDVGGLRLIFEEIARDRDGLLRKRQNAYRAGHEHYDSGILAKQWIELFREIGMR